MKKSILLFAMGLAVLTACDPEKETKDLELNYVSESDIEGCLTIVQTDEAGNPAADGNYFSYTTSPATDVAFYNILASGDENVLAHGSSGSFILLPKRGSDPNQTFYVRVVNTDGSISKISKTYTVFVKQDLDPEIRLLASDAYGKKRWKWDTTVHESGAFWGNMGYCGGSGEDVGTFGNGYWWGMTSDEDFAGQLKHSHDGAYHGEGLKAWMEFDEDGKVTCFNENGEAYQSDSYAVEGYNPSGEWRKGLLKTTAILWPYQINWADNGNPAVPGEYEIVYLTPDKMTLVYPDGGAYDALGGWGEATYWHFYSDSDIEGMAVGYGKTASKDWTWDYDGTNTVWGNMGYCGGEGAKVGTGHEGQWWGVVTEEEFAGQLKHSNTGALNGDESPNAYFTLDADGNITRHAGDGSVINKGTYSIDVVEGNAWKVANLNTTAGTILWPFEINWADNGNDPCPTTFEVVYLTNNKMCLVYPDGGAFDSNGGWGEATYWHFKAK